MVISEIVTISCKSFLIETLKEEFKVYNYSTPKEFAVSGVETAPLLILDCTDYNSDDLSSEQISKHKGLSICITNGYCDKALPLFYGFDFVISGPCNSSRTVSQLKLLLSEIMLRDDLLNCPISVVNREKEKAEQKKCISLNGFFSGVSECMYKLHERIKKAAENDFPVLLLGETGVGKSTAARVIHEFSARRHMKFKPVDLSTYVESLSESQFYGTAAHAFTDAEETEGLLSETRGGTLFLDEIGNAKIDIQANLLSPLETKTIYKVGSTKQESIDVRMIFATNADILQLLKEGLFKKDLYYRIYDNTIKMPSLREHLEDLPYMIKEFCEKQAVEIASSAVSKLLKHTWPGNLREFYKCLVKATCECNKTIIQPEHIEFGILG